MTSRFSAYFVISFCLFLFQGSLAYAGCLIPFELCKAKDLGCIGTDSGDLCTDLEKETYISALKQSTGQFPFAYDKAACFSLAEKSGPNLACSIPLLATYTDSEGESYAKTVFPSNMQPKAPMNSLYVLNLTPAANGFEVTFSQQIEASVLSLLGATSSEPADVSVQGATSGTLKGSMILSADKRTLAFISEKGTLSNDSFSVTLRSATDAFRTPGGLLLHAKAIGQPGEDYSTVVNGPNEKTSLLLPSFAYAPGQQVNGQAGLPVTLVSAGDITSVKFKLNYDSKLLEVNQVLPGSGAPAGSSVQMTGSAGDVEVTFTSAVPVSSGVKDIIRLVSFVPANVADKSTQVVALRNVRYNGSESVNNRSFLAAQLVSSANSLGTGPVETPSLGAELAGHWELNESSYLGNGSSEVKDSSGLGRHARITGGTIPSSPGVFGGAMNGSSLSGRHLRMTSSLIGPSSEKITVQLWLKTTDLTPYRALASRRNHAQLNGWMLQMGNGNGKIYVRIDTSAKVNQTSACNAMGSASPVVADGNWHHIAFTIDNGVCRLYIDGNKMSEGTYERGNGWLADSELLFTPGLNQMDEIAVWNRPLSGQEITAVAKRGTPQTIPLGSQTELAGHWELNESSYLGNGSSEVKDSSGLGRHARITGGAIPSSPGVFGGAMNGSSLSGRHLRMTSSLIGPSSEKITVQLWLKTTDLTPYRALASRRNYGQMNGWMLQMGNGNGKIYVRIDTSAKANQTSACSATSSASPVVADGNWHHIAFTIDNGVCRLYIDGNKMSEGTYERGNGLLPDSELLFTPGLNQIDEIAVWNRPLSGQEITAVAKRGTPQTIPLGSQTELAGHWELNDSSYLGNGSSEVKDSSGLGRHARITGGTIPSSPGVFGGAMNGLSLSGRHLRMTSSLIGPSTERFTVQLWLKTTDLTPYRAVASRRNYAQMNGWMLQMGNGNGKIYVRIDTSAKANQTSACNAMSSASPVVADGNWHHIAFTIDNGVCRLYIDGNKMSEGTYERGNGLLPDSELLFTPGLNQIDEIAVWNRPLNSVEIQAIARQPK